MNTMTISRGMIVQHFKRETLGKEKGDKYLYEVLAVAENTETSEKYVIYQALYGKYKVFARPYDMFMSEVDRQKYPNIKQQYCFERYIEKPSDTSLYILKVIADGKEIMVQMFNSLDHAKREVANILPLYQKDYCGIVCNETLTRISYHGNSYVEIIIIPVNDC